MKDLEEHKKIAVLIDAENAQKSKLQSILDELSKHGHVVTKRAYGDWSNENLKNWKKTLNQLAIQPIQQFVNTPGKNAADIAMVIDAMDLLYTRKFDVFALISSDSDFTKLALRLRESEIFVFGFGEKKAPVSFRSACDNFVFTEKIEPFDMEEQTPDYSVKETPEDAQLIKLMADAWEQHAEDDGWTNVSAVGSWIKEESDFDPRNYDKEYATLSELIENKFKDYFEVKRYKKSKSIIVAFRPRDSNT